MDIINGHHSCTINGVTLVNALLYAIARPVILRFLGGRIIWTRSFSKKARIPKERERSPGHSCFFKCVVKLEVSPYTLDYGHEAEYSKLFSNRKLPRFGEVCPVCDHL